MRIPVRAQARARLPAGPAQGVSGELLADPAIAGELVPLAPLVPAGAVMGLGEAGRLVPMNAAGAIDVTFGVTGIEKCVADLTVAAEALSEFDPLPVALSA